MADGRFITELTTRIHAFSSPQKFSRNSSSPKFKILHYISLSIQSLPLRKEDLLKSSFFSSLILSHYRSFYTSISWKESRIVASSSKPSWWFFRSHFFRGQLERTTSARSPPLFIATPIPTRKFTARHRNVEAALLHAAGSAADKAEFPEIGGAPETEAAPSCVPQIPLFAFDHYPVKNRPCRNVALFFLL